MSTSAAHARLKNVVIDRGVQDPRGARRRRGPGTRRQALPPHRQGRLPDHPADDRPAGRLTLVRVLSVASELFPLIKTGGLADVAGALPGALAPLGVEMRTLVPGYPAVLAGLQRRHGSCTGSTTLFGGPARLLAAGAAPARTCWSSTRRISIGRPGNPYLGAGRPRLAGQCRRFGRSAGSRPRSALGPPRRLAARPGARPRLAGGTGAGLSRVRARGRPAGHGDDRPQSGLPGPVRRRPASASSACRRRRFAGRRRRVLRPDRLSQGRAVLRRPADHGQPDLRAGDPDRGRGHGSAMACCARRADVWSASSTASTTRSGTRRPTRDLAADL